MCIALIKHSIDCFTHTRRCQQHTYPCLWQQNCHFHPQYSHLEVRALSTPTLSAPFSAQISSTSTPRWSTWATANSSTCTTWQWQHRALARWVHPVKLLQLCQQQFCTDPAGVPRDQYSAGPPTTTKSWRDVDLICGYNQNSDGKGWHSEDRGDHPFWALRVSGHAFWSAELSTSFSALDGPSVSWTGLPFLLSRRHLGRKSHSWRTGGTPPTTFHATRTIRPSAEPREVRIWSCRNWLPRPPSHAVWRLSAATESSSYHAVSATENGTSFARIYWTDKLLPPFHSSRGRQTATIVCGPHVTTTRVDMDRRTKLRISGLQRCAGDNHTPSSSADKCAHITHDRRVGHGSWRCFSSVSGWQLATTRLLQQKIQTTRNKIQRLRPRTPCHVPRSQSLSLLSQSPALYHLHRPKTIDIRIQQSFWTMVSKTTMPPFSHLWIFNGHLTVAGKANIVADALSRVAVTPALRHHSSTTKS